jgi:hypothetical protein
VNGPSLDEKTMPIVGSEVYDRIEASALVEGKMVAFHQIVVRVEQL